jgi:hypothetical protein
MFSFFVLLLGHWKNRACEFAGSTSKQAATQLERDMKYVPISPISAPAAAQ